MKYVLAYDLGTGGIKTSLFSQDGHSVAYCFEAYDTYFPTHGFREQRPEEWWKATVCTTKQVLQTSGIDKRDIVALAVSGHSLGVVPIGKNGVLLAESVPLWNDARATREACSFFEHISQEEWYLSTGNGFPAELYSVFKIIWYKNNMPELYEQTDKFIGTKDYINYRLTGVLCTDHSYASGSGVYNLERFCYNEKYIACSGIDRDKLPEILQSTAVIGTILPEVAKELGLSVETKVCCGGVDNACMALGAGCIGEGDVYTSLGTSAWIAVSSSKPVVDVQKKPYVFAHCVEGMFVSATAIFSAGNSLRWVRDRLFADFLEKEQQDGTDSYVKIDAMAQTSPLGANGLFFLPTLAGGSALDRSPNARGGLVGLDLMHTREDICRACLEGIALNLRLALDVLKRYCAVGDSMLLVGGGAKSPVWRDIFAQVYDMPVVTGKIAQDAGSFGAAVVAAVGAGLWKDFSKVKQLCAPQTKTEIKKAESNYYQRLLPVYERILDMQSDIGDMINEYRKGNKHE